MNIGMIVNSMTTANVNSSQVNDAETNRTSFLEMLMGVTMEAEGEASTELMMGGEDYAQLSLPVDLLTDEQLEEIYNEVEQLLNLLPDYLKVEIEQLLEQNNEFNFDITDLSEENLTLAQMFASFIQFVNRLQVDRQIQNQQPLEQMRMMLQEAVKTEAQITGLNANEILSKLDKIVNSTNQVKTNYLQDVVTRLHQPMKQGEQQTGLNMTGVQDPSQAMSRVQQFVIHIGEQPTKEAEQRQFIRQFQDILGKGLLRQLNNGTTQFTIKLHPQHLGRLDIQFLQTNGLITAKITASTNAAREMIEAQLQQLRNTFVQQQINVERIEVTQQQQHYQLNKDGEGKQRQDDGRKSKEKEDQQNEESFANLLDEITFNEKV